MAIRIHRSGETIYGEFSSGDVHINLSRAQENLLLESGVAVRLEEEDMSIVLAGAGGGGASDSTVGTLTQFGAIRALTDGNKYSVTADALVISGPCIVKGFRCLTGTSIVGVYDALSATGTNLMPSVTTAANTEYLFAGEGGVLFSAGLYVDWGSGTYIFYALPVEA